MKEKKMKTRFGIDGRWFEVQTQEEFDAVMEFYHGRANAEDVAKFMTRRGNESGEK